MGPPAVHLPTAITIILAHSDASSASRYGKYRNLRRANVIRCANVITITGSGLFRRRWLRDRSRSRLSTWSATMPDTLGSLDDMHEHLDRICEKATQLIAENSRIRLQSRQLLERIYRQAVHGVTSGAAGPSKG